MRWEESKANAILEQIGLHYRLTSSDAAPLIFDRKVIATYAHLRDPSHKEMDEV